MSPNMKMETTSGGGVGKVFARMFSGESLFLNRYTAEGGAGTIAFASSFPGEIKAYRIEPGKSMIVQKRGFLAAESGVELSAYVQKSLAKGLVGGEGLFNTTITGPGRLILQTLPLANIAQILMPFFTSKN